MRPARHFRVVNSVTRQIRRCSDAPTGPNDSFWVFGVFEDVGGESYRRYCGNRAYFNANRSDIHSALDHGLMPTDLVDVGRLINIIAAQRSRSALPWTARAIRTDDINRFGGSRIPSAHQMRPGTAHMCSVISSSNTVSRSVLVNCLSSPSGPVSDRPCSFAKRTSSVAAASSADGGVDSSSSPHPVSSSRHPLAEHSPSVSGRNTD